MWWISNAFRGIACGLHTSRSRHSLPRRLSASKSAESLSARYSTVLPVCLRACVLACVLMWLVGLGALCGVRVQRTCAKVANLYERFCMNLHFDNNKHLEMLGGARKQDIYNSSHEIPVQWRDQASPKHNPRKHYQQLFHVFDNLRKSITCTHQQCII